MLPSKQCLAETDAKKESDSSAGSLLEQGLPLASSLLRGEGGEAPNASGVKRFSAIPSHYQYNKDTNHRNIWTTKTCNPGETYF